MSDVGDESTVSLAGGTRPLASAESIAAGLPTAQVHIRPHKGGPFFGRHPWMLDKAIDRIEGEPLDGDVVDVISDKGKFIARGIYNGASRIRVRLYSWSAVPLDDAFWKARLSEAIDLRRGLGLLEADGAARLVFSEADFLSGLIVDRYGDFLSLQVTALAIAVRLELIAELLHELLTPRGMVVRTEKGIAHAEGLDLRDGPLRGALPDGPVFIHEHGLKFGVDLSTGQKTGYYLDQRDNRRAAANYMRGRRVLDMFCYTGGFALSALALGGAREVLAIDTSAKAIATAEANAALNGIAGARFQAEDGFQALDRLLAAGERFDAVILDPPKFARSRHAATDALRAYHRINRLGCELLAPGGILVTCSCSGHVTREDFLYMLVGVAQQTKRDIQILETRGAAPDHPVSATCVETEYLKCFICRVL